MRGVAYMNRDYDRSKTAITRGTFVSSRLSNPMAVLVNKRLLENKSILDYGCGKGRDVHLLSWMRVRRDKEIVGYDKYDSDYDCKVALHKTYEVVTCHYVFNVIPSLEECREVLGELKRLGKEVYISVRADKKNIKGGWEYDENGKGYWTTKGTFQRFYDEELIRQEFGDVEYISNTCSYKLFKLKND